MGISPTTDMKASRWIWMSGTGWWPIWASIRAMILANHGLLVAGRSIPEAFHNIYYLERACQAQVAAMSGGAELILPPEEVRLRTAAQFNRPREDALAQYDAAGVSALRLIDGDRPDYRG